MHIAHSQNFRDTVPLLFCLVFSYPGEARACADAGNIQAELNIRLNGARYLQAGGDVAYRVLNIVPNTLHYLHAARNSDKCNLCKHI